MWDGYTCVYDGRDRSMADGRHGVRISKKGRRLLLFLSLSPWVPSPLDYRSSSAQSLAAQAGSGVSYSHPGPQ